MLALGADAPPTDDTVELQLRFLTVFPFFFIPTLHEN